MAVTEETKAVAEEARRKAEVKATRLEVDRMSLLLDLGTTKDEVSSLQSQANKDKEAMEEEYQKTLGSIFGYDYKCYVFKHNICGDQPKVPCGMPDSANPLLPEFFVSPRCPSIQAAIEDAAVEAHPGEVAKELEENASVGGQSSFIFLLLIFFFYNLYKGPHLGTKTYFL